MTTALKSSQLPPVRVEAEVRAEIESALRDGESLSEFVKTAALNAARQRQAQAAFVARGRASLAQALHSGEFHAPEPALQAMQARMDSRLGRALVAAEAAPGSKPR